MTEDAVETAINIQTTQAETKDTVETRMDIDTAHAEARELVQDMPDTKKQLDLHHLTPSGDRIEVPDNTTAAYELTNQFLDQLKEKNPREYDARILAQKATNSIAGRLGEKMAGYLTSKIITTANDTARTGPPKTDEELIGVSLGQVVKGTETDIQTKIDLFQFGISKIEQGKVFKPINVKVDINEADRKQTMFDESKLQQSKSNTTPDK